MRWIFRLVGVLVLVVVLAIVAVVLLPTERIANLAADRISEATGRTVSIEGEISPTLWPSLGVRAEQFEIGNPDWVEDGPLISAEALSVTVPWSAVLSAQVAIQEATLIGPNITLVRAADGRVSWDFSGGAMGAGASDAVAAPSTETAAAEEEGGLAFALDQATLRDANLLYLDASSDTRIAINGLDADIALPAQGAAEIAAVASVNGTELEVDATIDGLTGLLAGEVRPITLALGWQGGEMGFDGRLSLDPSLDGAVTLDATDFAPLMALAGQPAIDLPDGFGRDRVALTGDVTVTEASSVHLRGGALALDDNRLTLDLDLLPGDERPLVRGTISGDALRLPAGSAGGGGGSSGGSGGGGGTASGWSTTPIDASGLFAADVELALRFGSLIADATTIAPFNARLTNSNGRAVLDIENAGVYGGTLAGQMVVNGRGGLSARTDVILAGVQLQPLLSSTVGYDRLEGSGSASLQVLAVGNDMATLMRSLDGQGDFAFGSGAIIGLDIAGMIRNFDTSFQGPGTRTVYDSVTANFTIAGGVLQNDDLRLDAPWGGVTGEGSVDIGAQTLNYRVIPGVIRDDQGGTGINVPILVSGAWANPSIQPDLAFLAEQELADEAARLEAEARERLEGEVRGAINDALGTDLGEGASIEDAGDALEDRLLEEAADQLQQLLGGN